MIGNYIKYAYLIITEIFGTVGNLCHSFFMGCLIAPANRDAPIPDT